MFNKRIADMRAERIGLNRGRFESLRKWCNRVRIDYMAANSVRNTRVMRQCVDTEAVRLRTATIHTFTYSDGWTDIVSVPRK